MRDLPVDVTAYIASVTQLDVVDVPLNTAPQHSYVPELGMVRATLRLESSRSDARA
jgi:hypothetical protein